MLDLDEYSGPGVAVRMVHLLCGAQLVCTPDRTRPGNHPCPCQSKRLRHTEELARSLAEKKNGRLLEWGGDGVTPSTWECAEGHRWKSTSNAVKAGGYWCRKCATTKRFRVAETTEGLESRRTAAKQLASYIRRDKEKGRVCDLNVDDVLAARKQHCVYCGRKANGLDRIDNERGHEKDNCIPACLRCNWMRGRYVSHETMLHVGKVLKEVDP